MTSPEPHSTARIPGRPRTLRPMAGDRTGGARGGRAALRGAAMGLALAIGAAGLAPGWLAPSPAAAQSADAPVPGLEGRFEGIGPARGMSLEITDIGARSPGGVFRDSNGLEAELEGGWKQGGLEAVLAFPERQVFVRLTEAALGLQMAVLPLDENGQPLRRQARILAFLREGVAAPEQPALYQEPPKRAGQELDPDVFLASYQFWPPEGVANGYDNIGARYRTVFRLFPQIHADIMWKLCDADSQKALLAEALRGQGATCADIDGAVERLQARGRFGDWKRAVQAEIDALMPAVQCARGYIVKASVCAPAAKRVSDAAVSLDTLGTLLSRWR
ncbi:MAG: hypothetical protein VYD87_12240 [Pseudomonadota bacterium]|nr:hypothetical protein [Pseudomonadota bacterium]MEE3100048.1 hypothetical protein [Pseudomonadota bacterium]